MQKRNVFSDDLVSQFASASRIPVVLPPQLLPASYLGRLESGGALDSPGQAEPPPCCDVRSHGRIGFAFTKAALCLVLGMLTLSAQSGVREIGAIGLTVDNLGRELAFYTNTLPFELVNISEAGKDQDMLFGLQNDRSRVAELKLGDEHITLTEHVGRKGRPIPTDSRSYDHWFQHIAIVVRDMDLAYEQLRQHKVKHISTGPQTLPAWNKGAAGIKAFYFRDPEDHVLEIIYFPAGKGDPKWQRLGRTNSSSLSPSHGESAGVRGSAVSPSTLDTRHSPLFLGIDHTAIVVSDTGKSLAFYRDLLGLRVAGESENYGVEQEHLNQVFGARLRITGLRAERGPGIEFLEYLTPPGGRPLPASATGSDLVFWYTHVIADHFDDFTSMLRAHQAKFVSTGVVSLSNPASQAKRSLIVRDPDGHALQFVETGSETAAATRP